MKELESQMLLEFKILSFPYRKMLTFVYAVETLILTFYVLSLGASMDIRKHQAFLVAVMICLMLSLQLLLLFMSCFYEKKYTERLKFICNAIEECNLKTADYWICAQMFMKFVGLKTNVAALTKKYYLFYCISKLTSIAFNGVSLCLMICFRVAYLDTMDWGKHMGFSLLFISILCLEIILSYYICCELYPGTKVTGMGLIIEYSLFLVLSQYIVQMKDIFSIFDPNVQKFWSEKQEIISSFVFSTTLILIIFSIIFWNFREKRGGTGIIWRRIAYYDQFANVFCGIAQSLYNIQNDAMIMDYFADTTGKRVLSYEKRKYMYEQYCMVYDCFGELTEEMKIQFAPLLKLFPSEIIEMMDEYYIGSFI